MTNLEKLMSRLEAKEKALDELKKDIAQLSKQTKYAKQKDEAKKAVRMIEIAKTVNVQSSGGELINFYEKLEKIYNKEQNEKRAERERKRAEAEAQAQQQDYNQGS